MPSLGLSLSVALGGGIVGVVQNVLTMTGLATSAPTDAATPGDHASLSVAYPSGVTAWTSQAWGVGTYGDATYGTGASPTDYAASDGQALLWEGVGDDGNTYRASAPIRYAPGSAPSIAAQNWAVDDDVISLDASATGANLTFTYSASSLPGNAAINSGTGAITVTGNGGAFASGDVGSGSISITATDQYGRTVAYSVSYTIALRAQATAADGLGPFAWYTGQAINQSTVSDFTVNGNTLSYVITGLPTGAVDDGDGTISGTPSAADSGTLTVTATDEYGRVTTSTPDFTVSVSAFTATKAIETSRLYDGQSISAMTNGAGDTYADMVASGNFASNVPGETVSTVTVTFYGTATTPADENEALAENNEVYFDVTVDGSLGTQTVFSTSETAITVEYDVRVTSTAGNEAEIDLNDLVPDAESVDIEITSPQEYAGTYTVTAGQLRQTNPLCFAGTHIITYEGALNNLDVGDVLTMQDPLAHTIADSLSITARAWLRGGTPISGSTGSQHTIVGSDQGQNLAPRATVEDNLGNSTVNDGTAIAIPAAASGVATPTVLGFGKVTAAGNAATITIDDSSVTTGNSVVVLVSAPSMQASQDQLPGATMTGESIARDAVSTAVGRTSSAIYRYEVASPGAGKSFVIGSKLETGADIHFRILAFSQTLTVYSADGKAIGGANPVDVTINTASGSVAVAIGCEDRPSSNNFSLEWNGPSMANQMTKQETGVESTRSGFEEITTGAAGQTVAVRHDDGNFHGSVAAVCYT